MGPVTHAATGRALGAPVLSSVWMDAPHLLRYMKPEWAGPGQALANKTHGWPGLAVAALLWGRRGVIGWMAHVALDTISHERGRGSHGQHRRSVWLP